MCKSHNIDKRLSDLKDDLSLIIKSFEDLNPGYDRNLGLSTSPDNDLLLSRSLLVLGHAELESFFEGLALDLLESSLQVWKDYGFVNYNLGALLFNASFKKEKDDSFSSIPEKAIKNYKEDTLRNNHGIKKRNLINLYEPLGYNLDKIDNDKIQQLIGTLDALGGRRGESAHHNQCSIHNPLSFPEVVNIFKKIALEDLGSFIDFLKEPL